MPDSATNCPSRFDTVLFDLGGVLVPDVWETILLTPKVGVADAMRLNRDRVREAAEQLWRRYAVVESSEPDYWSDLGALLGVKIPEDRVFDAYKLLVANPAAAATLESLARSDISIGIISNNTTFWFERQLQLLPALRRLGDRDLWFISCWCRTTKGESPGLFDLAARHVVPPTTLVVDDRVSSIKAARRRGFLTYRYKPPSRALIPTRT